MITAENIKQIKKLYIVIENYFKENTNIYKYINYNLFSNDLELTFVSLNDCKSNSDDLDYWCSNLNQTMTELLNEIERANKMLKYELSVELSTFLNSIAK